MEATISKFILDNATCVILGAWNTAILNPMWLAQKVFDLPQDAQMPMELSGGILGIPTYFRAQIKGLYIIPTAEKFIINPSKEEEALFELTDIAVSKLYNILPHTPILALGHNFSYEIEGDEVFSLDFDFSAYHWGKIYKNIEASPASEALIQHSLYLMGDPYVILNISFKIAGEKKFLNLNYHYQVDNDSDKIKNALGKFRQNYKHSKLISITLIAEKGA